MGRKLTTEEFIRRAKEVHGDKYDYSKTIYKRAKDKVTIICRKHGEFKQAPFSHFYFECGCTKCGANYSDTNKFIEKVKKIHGDMYDYSKVKYTGKNEEIIIGCYTHGDFTIRANDFCYGERKGCPKCSIEKKRKKRVEKLLKVFIEKSNIIHNNKYDYSKVNYITNIIPILISCPIHGDFEQKPSHHLLGSGCPICGDISMREKLNKGKNFFIEEYYNKYGKIYDLSNIIYINANIKVEVTCLKHGKFKITPMKLLYGSGCPNCIKSKGEIRLKNFLEKNNMYFEQQYRISECKNKKPLPFDFAIFEDEEKTKLKCLIEYDGEQHYKAIPYFGGEKRYSIQQKRDNIKNEYCKNNSIPLYRINYIDNINSDKIDTILRNLLC